MYINSTNSDVYGPKTAGGWGGVVCNIRGTTGATGPAGYSPQYIVAAGVPSAGLGNNGDMYINSSTSDVYGPKAAGAWGAIACNIKGLTGAQGPPGVASTPQGAWSASTTYAQGDLVTYQSALYIGLVAGNLNHVPSTSPTYWQTVVTTGQTPWTQDISGAGFRLLNAGNVGIGNNLAALPDAATADTHLVVGPTATAGTASGEITAAGNVSAASTQVGIVNFANYNLSTAEKRVAAIAGATDSVVNSGILTFSTSNVGAVAERMRITSTGNVGIGTIPIARLHLVASAQVDPSLTYGSASAWILNGVGVELAGGVGPEAGAGVWLQTRASNSTAYPLSLNPLGGNVGIGTGTAIPDRPLSFAPSVGDKITLYAGQMWGFGMAASLLQIITTSNVGDVAFGYGTSASFTEVMRVKGSGLVGIGMSNPGALLSLSKQFGASESAITILANIAGATVSSLQWQHYTGNESAAIKVNANTANNFVSSLSFEVNNGGGAVEMMRLTPNGLGIGTASPTASLQVDNTAPDTQVYISSSGPRIALGNNAVFGSRTQGFRIVLATANNQFGPFNSGDAWLFTEGANSGIAGNLYFGANLRQTMVLTTAGLCGLGKAAPAYALDVTGDVNCTGAYRVNGNPIGQLTTQTKPARAIGAVYQNTTGKPMCVLIVTQASPAPASVAAYCDSAASPATFICQQGGDSSDIYSMSFWVMPGYYYKLTNYAGTSAIIDWVEYY
jgi:hypothetical protein